MDGKYVLNHDQWGKRTEIAEVEEEGGEKTHRERYEDEGKKMKQKERQTEQVVHSRRSRQQYRYQFPFLYFGEGHRVPHKGSSTCHAWLAFRSISFIYPFLFSSLHLHLFLFSACIL